MSITLSTIEIQTLESKYSTALAEHERLYKTYIQQLITQKTSNSNTVPSQTQSSTSTTTKFRTVPEHSYWGAHPLQSIDNISTVAECEARCSTDEQCTGATFNSNKKQCWTRGGHGQVVTGSTDDTAIVSDIADSAQSLQELNDEIMKLREQLSTAREQQSTEYKESEKHVSEQAMDVDKYDKMVYNERKELETMEKKHGTLLEQNKDSTMFATQQHLQLILWAILALILMFIIVRQFGSIAIQQVTFLYTAITIIIGIGIYVVVMKMKKT